METSNYKIDLLSQNQAMKEYTINHAFNKVDWLLNRTAIDLLSEPPENKSEGDMYLLENGTIIIYLNEKWQPLAPSDGTILYVLAKSKFHVLLDGNWNIAKAF